MPIDYTKARRTLARRDPILRDLMRRHGPCGLARSQHTDPFQALVHAIISQQLSTKAAATIAGRVDALLDGLPTPARVAAVSDAQLRSAGLSGQKVGYLRDLSGRIADESLPLDTLDLMPDEEVIVALTRVKGIGRWTAEMFLMFRLHRPDVLPVGDLGIVKAVQRAYRLRTLPSPARLLRLGESWRPYRSVACWYLWASLQNKNVPAQE
ncbi:MAG: DNA-3-methyladenine glycosylase 2 family protein [Acidobacteria bacterium]|nr:DNA-3-methyladenine glycosylase 2 family protein [Acidobacteriota bacterium]MSO82188.1 DNA-3-methyladenine glycosylase 2 family protein [Acidobacteriota bacterium]